MLGNISISYGYKAQEETIPILGQMQESRLSDKRSIEGHWSKVQVAPKPGGSDKNQTFSMAKVLL